LTFDEILSKCLCDVDAGADAGASDESIHQLRFSVFIGLEKM
jgi:hypothetical protein